MTYASDLLAIACELDGIDTRLAIRLRSVTHEVSRMERMMDEIIGDAEDSEHAQAEREAVTKSAVIRDLAIDRAPNVQRMSARFGGMPFCVHAVGDAL